MNYWTQSETNIFVAAHRGWRDRYPENTMAAFKAAMDIGVDQIETDVRITKDGYLVLIHDPTVDRTTNGTGKVRDMTLKELQALDAGDGQKIPELWELFELVKDHPTITLDLELKEYPEPGWEEVSHSVCDRVLKMVDDYGFTDRVVINSGNGMLNEYVHKTYGNRYRQHLYYPPASMGACTISPYSYGYCACIGGVTRGSVTVEEVRQFVRNTGVQPWMGRRVSDEPSIDIAVKMGATLITCDNPDEVLAILRKKKLHK